MKKIFLLLLVAITTVSCTKEVVESTHWEIIPVTINGWRESPVTESLYYTASVFVPELTPFIRDKGTVLVYRDFGNGYQQILPFTRHKEDGDVRWTQTIDYEFTDGKINFYVTNSDFFPDPPETMYFRVVLIW